VWANGQTAAAPSWDLQLTAKAGGGLASASRVRGIDAASWYHFAVPWFYCAQFALDTSRRRGKHFFRITHSISSRVKIFLSGNEVADKSFQAGAYGGQRYDIVRNTAHWNSMELIGAATA